MTVTEMTTAKTGLEYTYSDFVLSFEEARISVKRRCKMEHIHHSYYQKEKSNGHTLYAIYTAYKHA